MCIAEEKKDEREVWESMTPEAWHNSVAGKDSVFFETYDATRKQIEQVAREGGHDVIIEVGCGTGDIIGALDTSIPHYGFDINPDFIRFCDENYPHDHCTFAVQDATTMIDWWNSNKMGEQYSKPLVTCVNSKSIGMYCTVLYCTRSCVTRDTHTTHTPSLTDTLNIMPDEIRGTVVAQMLAVAGEQGCCLVTYWNGNFFSHAIMNYYRKNQALCGKFNMKQDIDWKQRTLLTPMGYSTEWHYPTEVQKLLRAYDVDVDEITDFTPGKDHINCDGLAIFVWFSVANTSRAKGYYGKESPYIHT